MLFRSTADALSGGGSVELVEQFNNVFGGSNEPNSPAGVRYRAPELEPIVNISDVRIWLEPLGPSAVLIGGVAGSGEVTGQVGVDQACPWEPSGWAVVQRAGVTIECVYYDRHTDSTFHVPANSRNRCRTSQAAWLAGDVITPLSGLAIAAERTSPAFHGSVQLLGSESAAPAGVTWKFPTAADPLLCGDLDAGNGLIPWLERDLPVNPIATPRHRVLVHIQWRIAGVTYYELLGGWWRVSDLAVRRLELRAAVGADPAIDATPVATQIVPAGQTARAYLQATPWTPDYVLTNNAVTHLVTDFRDEFNFRSEAIETTKIKVSGGAEATRPPSAPESITCVPAAGGKIKVTASYLYDRDATAQQGDQFALWYTTDGSDPVASGSPTATVAIVQDGTGLALLLGPNGEPFWLSGTYSNGTIFKVIVRTRRAGDGVTSTNSDIHTATAAAVAPGSVAGSLFYRGVAEQVL